MVTDQVIIFLAPYSCRVNQMVSNSKSRHTEFTEDTMKKQLERCLFLLFLDNLAVCFGSSDIAG
jgi:hypothetical protein